MQRAEETTMKQEKLVITVVDIYKPSQVAFIWQFRVCSMNVEV
jgi:hypothetical protein